MIGKEAKAEGIGIVSEAPSSPPLQSTLIEEPRRWDAPQIRAWHEARKRFLECPVCLEIVTSSVVPHLRTKHPDFWADRFVRVFREMHIAGYGAKQIMWHFGRTFTWMVIARELTDEDGQLAPIDPAKVQLDPNVFKLQTTTRWSFPQRGRWGVHDSQYRGNWAPDVARNLILRYSKDGDLVVDPFVGGGTTVLEAMGLVRQAAGFDISPRAVNLTTHKAKALAAALADRERPVLPFQIGVADARALPIADDSAALVCAHPPYLNIVRYTKSNSRDLSSIFDPGRFAYEMARTAAEIARILKTGGYCAVMIGDVRKTGRLIPLGFLTMRAFIGALDLKDIIIKDIHQSHMGMFWDKTSYGKFLYMAHEYLFVFQKPKAGADLPAYLQRL